MPMAPGNQQQWALGSNDILYPVHSDNVPVVGICTPSAPSVFNLFGGNSFYLNGFIIYVDLNLAGTQTFITPTIYIGPNSNSLVGATAIFLQGMNVPTVAPSNTGLPFILANVNNVGYHNKSGNPAYCHISLQQTVSNGNVTFNLLGGVTKLTT